MSQQWTCSNTKCNEDTMMYVIGQRADLDTLTETNWRKKPIADRPWHFKYEYLPNWKCAIQTCIDKHNEPKLYSNCGRHVRCAISISYVISNARNTHISVITLLKMNVCTMHMNDGCYLEVKWFASAIQFTLHSICEYSHMHRSHINFMKFPSIAIAYNASEQCLSISNRNEGNNLEDQCHK